MPKCDFNKVALQSYFRHGCSPVNLLHIFRTPFSNNTSGGLFLYLPTYYPIYLPTYSPTLARIRKRSSKFSPEASAIIFLKATST